jgi:hypothetical protein
MKKKHGVFFGFAVLLIAAIFTLTGCGDSGTGDPTTPPGGGDPVFTFPVVSTSLWFFDTNKIIVDVDDGQDPRLTFKEEQFNGQDQLADDTTPTASQLGFTILVNETEHTTFKYVLITPNHIRFTIESAADPGDDAVVKIKYDKPSQSERQIEIYNTGTGETTYLNSFVYSGAIPHDDDY